MSDELERLENALRAATPEASAEARRRADHRSDGGI